jgi:hypothetical protein
MILFTPCNGEEIAPVLTGARGVCRASRVRSSPCPCTSARPQRRLSSGQHRLDSGRSAIVVVRTPDRRGVAALALAAAVAPRQRDRILSWRGRLDGRAPRVPELPASSASRGSSCVRDCWATTGGSGGSCAFEGSGSCELATAFAGGLLEVECGRLPRHRESPGLHPSLFSEGKEGFAAGAGSCCEEGAPDGVGAVVSGDEPLDVVKEPLFLASIPIQCRRTNSPPTSTAMTPSATSTLSMTVSRLRALVMSTGIIWAFGSCKPGSHALSAALNHSRPKRARQRAKAVINLNMKRQHP